MIFFASFLILLVASSTDAAVKGGARIVHASPFGQHVAAPVVHVGKGGGLGGAVHHTAVVQDPISGAPVIVSRGGGIKTAGLGAGSGQIVVSTDPFGQRSLYRVGQSQIPYGLMGSDYYSYPSSLLTAPRGLRTKTVVSDNLSGLSPVVEFGRRLGGIKGGAPRLNRFAVGDAQIKTNVFGARRPIYRSGVSSLPYGLTGLDYFSYPKHPLGLYGGAPSKIGGLAIGGLPAVGHAPFVQQQAVSPISQFSVGDAQASLLGSFNPLYRSGVSSLPYGLTGLDYFSYPKHPLSYLRGPSKIGGLATGGLPAVGHAPIVQQQVVSPISQFSAGDAQTSLLGSYNPLYRSGVSSLPYGLTGLDYFSYPKHPLSYLRGPSKIGGLSTGGLHAVGHAPIVQQQVVSPISQFSVGDAQTSLLGSYNPLYRSGVSSLPYGLTGLDYFSYPKHPLGLLRGPSKMSHVAQNPIEAALLGNAGLGHTVQSLVDPLGSGQTQVSVDDIIGHGGHGVTQVKETYVEEPLTGEVHKVTEVTKGGDHGHLGQHNIADSIVQESISSGLGGYGGYGYSPRVSFLSQHPYDAPDTGLLRSIVTRPVQQEVEQILV